MLSLGWQEMVVIFLAALVLFGPKKLPELGRTIGKAITEFRRASNELKQTFDREMQTIERENESLRETTQKYLDDISGESGSASNYSSSSPTQTGSYEDSSYYDSAYYDSEAYRSQNETTSASDSTSADSTTATSSTVGEPAPQGAESAAAQTAGDSRAFEPQSAEAFATRLAEGTVPRGANTGSEPQPSSSPSPAAEKA